MSFINPSRLPFRTKQSIQAWGLHHVESVQPSCSNTQCFRPSAIARHASSTSTPSKLDAANKAPPKYYKNTRYLTRIRSPAERNYKARKALDKHIGPMPIDPYTRKIMETRGAAIKARQQGGRLAAAEKIPDSPIFGRTDPTPFVQSLDLGMPVDKVHIPDENRVPSHPPKVVDTNLKDHAAILASENTGVAKPDQLAFSVSSEELARFGQLSAASSAPIPSSNRAIADPQVEVQKKAQHEEDHATRMAALARILAVENQGSKQRHYINKERIISEFGRHETDLTIDPRQNIKRPYHAEDWTPKERIGPDTGSSEVQIALLTAKIRALSQGVGAVNKKDKANKRNLRLLLHRRQKLLAYFYRRDQAGERWQHMVEKLGITPAMWKGEIEVRTLEREGELAPQDVRA